MLDAKLTCLRCAVLLVPSLKRRCFVHTNNLMLWASRAIHLLHLVLSIWCLQHRSVLRVMLLRMASAVFSRFFCYANSLSMFFHWHFLCSVFSGSRFFLSFQLSASWDCSRYFCQFQTAFGAASWSDAICLCTNWPCFQKWNRSTLWSPSCPVGCTQTHFPHPFSVWLTTHMM